MTHYNDLRTYLDEVVINDEQREAVLRLIASQPDADLLADALGVAS